MTAHTGVVTVATTNDASRLDDAPKRAARFDRIVDMPPPPLEARRRILDHYLAHLDGDFDTTRLATATEGATGADLREIVRHAVLTTDGEITTQRLLDCAQQGPSPGLHGTGSYL
jgi:SpoVK/Ycf46/Vps4 family AAA+-type ATPase